MVWLGIGRSTTGARGGSSAATAAVVESVRRILWITSFGQQRRDELLEEAGGLDFGEFRGRQDGRAGEMLLGAVTNSRHGDAIG